MTKKEYFVKAFMVLEGKQCLDCLTMVTLEQVSCTETGFILQLKVILAERQIVNAEYK